MIILDSDVFTHLTYEHPNVCRHYEAVSGEEEFAVTVITRMEVLRGRTESILKAADERELLEATKRFQLTEEALNNFLLLHVDAVAAGHFSRLRAQKKLGKMKRPDLLIACIGLMLANWVDD
jgi:tRNA(fMet)-specific endonuclease VapC